MPMTRIERNIQVNYRQQVHFVDGAFNPQSTLMRDVLVDGSQQRRHRVLVVVDEALAQAQPKLLRDIEVYFAAFARELNLVCPPIVMEGGERTKNSTFTFRRFIRRLIASISTGIRM